MQTEILNGHSHNETLLVVQKRRQATKSIESGKSESVQWKYGEIRQQLGKPVFYTHLWLLAEGQILEFAINPRPIK